MADTLRVAIEKGQPLPPEIVDAMSSNVRATGMPPSPQRDMRTGIIWLGIAAGFVALGAIAGFEEPDVTYWMLGLAGVPRPSSAWRSSPWASSIGEVLEIEPGDQAHAGLKTLKVRQPARRGAVHPRGDR